MVEKTFIIEFKGYWREPTLNGIPDSSGVYCVYGCTYDSHSKKVDIHRLIYIGEADKVRSRIGNHEKKEEWMRYLESGNVLCFSFASVSSDYRDRIEAALIFHHKPPANDEYKDRYSFDRTTISIRGSAARLDKNFTVNRTE